MTRNGQFEKYVFLPNDAIPLYGMPTWQHRDAIPQELLKMVRRIEEWFAATTFVLPDQQDCLLTTTRPARLDASRRHPRQPYLYL